MPTYMKCRIMHVEVTHTLDTDSFIMALMRFITQRENVQTMFKKKFSFSVSEISWQEHYRKWTTKIFKRLCKRLLLIGSSRGGTPFLLVTCVVCWRKTLHTIFVPGNSFGSLHTLIFNADSWKIARWRVTSDILTET